MGKQRYFRKGCILLAACVVIISSSMVFAEIPFGVSTTQVQMTGTVDADFYVDLLPGGKAGYFDDWQQGQWKSIRISGISYDLTFWNVGKLGGKTGRLWWQKDYEDALLILNYEVSEYGFIVGKPASIGGMASYPMEEAAKAPGLKPVEIKLKFSGGPTGTFVEAPPYYLGEALTGRVMDGKYIIFDPPAGMNQDIALGHFCLESLIIPGDPFYKWTVEEDNRIDSDVRFAGLSGQVEVRPGDDEDAWDFARMGMILYQEDHIKTGPRSGAILGFRDLSTFVMKAETEIILATPPDKETKLQLVVGNLMVNVRQLLKDGTIEVTMNQGVLGTKGTVFICEETGSTSTVWVLEGAVEYRHHNGNTILVEAGEKVAATSQGPGEKETFDVEAEAQEWEALTESMEAEVTPPETAASTEEPAAITEKSMDMLFPAAGAGLVIMLILLMSLVKRKRK